MREISNNILNSTSASRITLRYKLIKCSEIFQMLVWRYSNTRKKTPETILQYNSWSCQWQKGKVMEQLYWRRKIFGEFDRPGTDVIIYNCVSTSNVIVASQCHVLEYWLMTIEFYVRYVFIIWCVINISSRQTSREKKHAHTRITPPVTSPTHLSFDDVLKRCAEPSVPLGHAPIFYNTNLTRNWYGEKESHYRYGASLRPLCFFTNI